MAFHTNLLKNRLYKMFHEKVPYIEVETAFTIHYLEHMMPDKKQYGRFQWTAKTNQLAWDEITTNPQAERCVINNNDRFPRYYYLEENIIHELLEWIKARGEEILKVYSPMFSDQI